MNAHPIAQWFPLLDDEALRELAKDIGTNGLIEPIVVRDGLILDGRNREAACGIAGVEPVYREWEGDEAEIAAWIISKNLHRRHLTTSQRAMIAARLATRDPGQRGATGAGVSVSQSEAATHLGISRDTVAEARVVLKSDDEALIDAVDKGRIRVSPAAAEVRRRNRFLRQLGAALEDAEVSPDALTASLDVQVACRCSRCRKPIPEPVCDRCREAS